MLRLIAFIVAILSATLVAHAQDNPLLGTWNAVSPATNAGPASILSLTFEADWHYQLRMLVGTNAAGTGSGMAITDGQYELTGPHSIRYWETRYQVCPSGGYCGDYPNPAPDFGQKKEGTFEMVGTSQMQAVGLIWTRQ